MTPLSTPAAQGTVAGWKHHALVVQIIGGMRRFNRRGGLGLDTHEALETWIDGLEAIIASPSPEAPASGVANDIVERLSNDGTSWAQGLFNEAAAEIIRLRSELAAALTSAPAPEDR